MPGEGDRARLLVVVEVNRHLLDLETVQTSDEKTFEIESKAAKGLARKNNFSGARRETLESGLGIENSREENLLRESVEQSAHQMSRVKVAEESRAHYVA